MEVNEFASFVDEQLEKVQVPSNHTFSEFLGRRQEKYEQIGVRRPSACELDSTKNIQWIPHSGPRPWRQQGGLFIINQPRVVVRKNVEGFMIMVVDNLEKEEQKDLEGCVRSDSKISLDFESHLLGDKASRGNICDKKTIDFDCFHMNESHTESKKLDLKLEISDKSSFKFDFDFKEIAIADLSPSSGKHSFFADIPEQLNFAAPIKKKRSSSMDFGILPRTNTYLSFLSLKYHQDSLDTVYYDPCAQAAKNFKSSQSRIKSFLKRSTTTKSIYESPRWSLDISRDHEKSSPSSINRFKSFFKPESSMLLEPVSPTSSTNPSSATSSTNGLTFHTPPRDVEIIRRSSYTPTSFFMNASKSQESIKSTITLDSIEFEKDSLSRGQTISKTLRKMRTIVRANLFGRKYESEKKLPSIPDY